MSRSALLSNLLAGAAAAATISLTSVAAAEPLPAVDVVIRDAPPPRRPVVLSWNPVALAVGRVSLDLVIVPREHHGLVLSPFCAWMNTAPINVFDDTGKSTRLPEQDFLGGGGELGYRYYFGRGGVRGLFLGPSVILAEFNVKAENGSQSQFLHFGVAADVGYQVLIADRFSLSLGGGAQLTATSPSLPPQQFPARIYANLGVMPRLLLSLGWAF